MKVRSCVVGLCFAVAGLPGTAASADPQGLDLTMQVLGKDEKVDDRPVNRIELPGARPGARLRGRTRAGSDPPAPPSPEEYQAWVEQYREAQRDRRREAWENYRQWREQQRK
ncbi:MAG TPA: hypothetical protein VJM11_10610 [Nevskiaceae bacterium]|nr:hypothetical protein [Nevskiaceae bacterium]